jgi:hypothetical protein
MNLTNKLTEEEFRNIIEDYLKFDDGCSDDNCPEEIDSCLDCYIGELKQAGLIRKSPLEEAREKTDKFIYEAYLGICNSKINNKLKQLIQFEREEADKKIKNEQ